MTGNYWELVMCTGHLLRTCCLSRTAAILQKNRTKQLPTPISSVVICYTFEKKCIYDIKWSIVEWNMNWIAWTIWFLYETYNIHRTLTITSFVECIAHKHSSYFQKCQHKTPRTHKYMNNYMVATMDNVKCMCPRCLHNLYKKLTSVQIKGNWTSSS